MAAAVPNKRSVQVIGTSAFGFQAGSIQIADDPTLRRFEAHQGHLARPAINLVAVTVTRKQRENKSSGVGDLACKRPDAVELRRGRKQDRWNLEVAFLCRGSSG